MSKLARLAFRNLYRQRRRTLLTVSIIAFGVVAVILFTALAGSFKNMMIGQITDSMLGHLQIHKSGYVESLDTMPLNMSISSDNMVSIEKILSELPQVEAFSPRILFGAMVSNYIDTTGVKLVGVDPAREKMVTPLLASRVVQGGYPGKGGILLPDLVARGMKFSTGDEAVVIATNSDGSVNGGGFKISGVAESSVGPSGKYGYVHIEDAAELLRMDAPQVSEIAIRLKAGVDPQNVAQGLKKTLGKFKDPEGAPLFEVHTWKTLSPFSNIANMIDLMTVFIQIILVTIVLISVMNVMLMAVYERTKEIGTLAAIGTLPGTIMSMFLLEGLFLGIFGVMAGNLAGGVLVVILRFMNLTVSFGKNDNILLMPSISPGTMAITSVIVIFVALLGVLEPALKASKLEPIEALKR